MKPRAKPTARTEPLFEDYESPPVTWDEIFDAQTPRPSTERVVEMLQSLGRTAFKNRQRIADSAFRRGGITFSVYSDQRGTEKTFPFDLIPRVIGGDDWEVIERGLKQRVAALNAFLTDIYGDQRLLDEGIVPRELIESCSGYRKEMRGVVPPGGVFVSIAGIDLLRDSSGKFVVLEDNVRVPSGVSYVLENRAVMKRIFPSIFQLARVRPINEYPLRLRESLASLSPVAPEETNIAVLTPGIFNSAYFEHSFLARRMGCALVEGRDLFVRDDRVYVKTTRGPQPVHVLYRRIDDDFLDPEAFRKDSVLGVKGILRAYRAGNVALCNAIGNGVADDKAIYPYVPEMIRFYLSEEPVLDQVATYLCTRKKDLDYVLAHLEELVVKEVDGAGGYGMLFGPSSTKAERTSFAEKLRADPRKFIAQPVVQFSTCPTWTRGGVAPRRVDLRPYIVSGKQGSWVLPGGLTRVALRAGSFVVNSSQGGGSKDTWVLEDNA